MSVLENPPLRNMDVPRGALVILSLDPVASVADMEDELSTTAAAKLPRGKYLAVVRGHEHDNTRLLFDQPLRFGFFTGGRGLPEPPYASLPLCPDADHPCGRPPLLPTPPLPWLDCYVHLFCGLTSIVTRIHFAASGTVWSVPGSEMRTILTAKWEELARRNHENPSEPEDDDNTESGSHSSSSEGLSTDDLDGRTGSSAPAPRSSTESLAGTRDGAPTRGRHSVHGSSTRNAEPPKSSRQSHHSATGSSAGVASGSRSPRASGSVALSSFSLKWEVPLMLRFRAEIWMDLTSVDNIDPPQELEEVLTALESLEEDWKGRMRLKELANQPRTTQWAEDIAASSFEDVSPVRPFSDADPVQQAAVVDPLAQGVLGGAGDVPSAAALDQSVPGFQTTAGSPAARAVREQVQGVPQQTIATSALDSLQSGPSNYTAGTPIPALRRRKGLPSFGGTKFSLVLSTALSPVRKLGDLFSRRPKQQ